MTRLMGRPLGLDENELRDLAAMESRVRGGGRLTGMERGKLSAWWLMTHEAERARIDQLRTADKRTGDKRRRKGTRR